MYRISTVATLSPDMEVCLELIFIQIVSLEKEARGELTYDDDDDDMMAMIIFLRK